MKINAVVWVEKANEAWRKQQAVHGNTLRMGQFYMNHLYGVCPELYNRITGTESDPFYRDDLMPSFFVSVWTHWDDYDHVQF